MKTTIITYLHGVCLLRVVLFILSNSSIFFFFFLLYTVIYTMTVYKLSNTALLLESIQNSYYVHKSNYKYVHINNWNKQYKTLWFCGYGHFSNFINYFIVLLYFYKPYKLLYIITYSVILLPFSHKNIGIYLPALYILNYFIIT